MSGAPTGRVVEGEGRLAVGPGAVTQAAIAASPVAFEALDAEGRIVLWNPAAEALLGWPADAVLGGPNPSVPPGSSEEAEIAERLAVAVAVRDVETVRRRADGRLVQVSLSAAPLLGADGSVLGRVHTLFDITERKLVESDRERSRAELAASNSELRGFTTALSHDLRAPLVTLQGYAAELARALEVLGPAARRGAATLPADEALDVEQALDELPESLAFVRAAVQRMDQLVAALMRLARLGRRELRAEEVDLAEVVAATLGALASEVRRAGATITVGSLPTVLADRVALEQVLTSLLENALRYLRPGVPGRVEVWGERDGDEVRCHVADNGRGIRPEDADAVWAPFQRAATDVPGEGMGLATVDALVRRSGGMVWFASTPGEGTTFTLRLRAPGADHG